MTNSWSCQLEIGDSHISLEQDITKVVIEAHIIAIVNLSQQMFLFTYIFQKSSNHLAEALQVESLFINCNILVIFMPEDWF